MQQKIKTKYNQKQTKQTKKTKQRKTQQIYTIK
jgi:hypothetical protein